MTIPKHITILAPTDMEAAAAGGGRSDIDTVICGVGIVETAATITRLYAQRKLGGLVILAGIAGACPGSGFRPGDSAVAVSEIIADMGAVRETGFVPLFPKTYECPLAETIDSVLPARFGTVNCVNGGRSTAQEYDIENMEGAAFFAVCSSLGIPFLEFRAVSNITTDQRDKWQIPLALEALADAVNKVLKELE